MIKILKNIVKLIILLFVLLNIIIIFHAYKFTHFYEASEISLKANDKKTTWDISKELLFGFNAIKQKNIAPDSAYQTIKLITNDGLTLDAWLTKVPNPKGSVVLFHGHAGKKTDVLQEAIAFQKMGYNTLMVDFRAHGNSDGNTCTIGAKEAIDVKTAYDYFEKSGEKDIILYGISLGAASIAKCINDYTISPSKIILEMPFGSLPSAVVGRVKMMQLPSQPISTLLTFWGGTIHGFWAFSVVPSEYAKKIKCPVLLQKGKLDPRVTDEENTSLFNNIPSPKKMVLYENSGHESLCKKEHEKWVLEVSSFLDK